jgi:PHD/YefM family antitoxin component YafN of YafNO toxin-antitoxin module
MTRKGTTEVRKDFSGTLSRVTKRRDRIVLQKRGKDVAALVPLEDLAMLEDLEDKLDVLDALRAEAEAAAKGEKPIPWERVKKDLGL